MMADSSNGSEKAIRDSAVRIVKPSFQVSRMELNSALNNQSLDLEDCPPDPTTEEETSYNTFQAYIRHTQSILCIFGVTGNAFAIYILMRKNMRNNFNKLIITLSLFDTMNLLVNLVNNLSDGTEANTLMFPYFIVPGTTFAERGVYIWS